MSPRTTTGIGRRQLLEAAATAAALPFVRSLSARAGISSTVTEIAPGIFVHKGHHALFAPDNAGDIANASFVVGKEAVAVIDTGGSALVGAAIRASIRATTGKPIRYVINTHMHPDHVFGNAAFADDQAPFVGHHKLARGLAARADRYIGINKGLLGDAAFQGTRIIMPTLAVDERLSLDLGGRILELEAHPTAHTDNDLTVRDKETDTLFMGDLLFAEHVPTLDGSIRGWLALMDRLASQPVARVVPGHGPPSMTWPDAIRPQQHYFTEIATDVRRLIKEGRSLSDATTSAAMSEKSAWLLFDDYHARNVSAAFAELEWE